MTPERFAPLAADDAAYLLQEARRFEPDWMLVLPYVPEEKRAAWLALLGFFAEVLTIPDRVSNPVLGAIRVAWWREALAEVYGEGPPRKHPVVLALAATISAALSIRPHLEGVLEAIEPFLEPGEDTDFDLALQRRLALYAPITQTFDVLEGRDPSRGEALALHALAQIQEDASAAATAEGPEPIKRRFARALVANPDLKGALQDQIKAFKRESCGNQPLAALPFTLVRVRGAEVRTVRHPLLQRLLLFKAVLTGSF